MLRVLLLVKFNQLIKAIGKITQLRIELGIGNVISYFCYARGPQYITSVTSIA
jgi:hypothetical protein